MTARALLEELRQAGLSISVTAEGLRVDGPAAVREAFREKIRTHKQELIDAIHDEARQLKDRERRLKVAKIRELARESLWRTHLERCRDCKPARPNCPNGKRLWQDYQDAIRGFIRATQIPSLPIDADLWERGKRLLYALWDAGYALRLVPSTRPAGWTIVPIGEATPSGDLLKLFDENHDAAVALLLEACRTAQCRPEDWPPLHLLYAATKYDGGGVSEL